MAVMPSMNNEIRFFLLSLARRSIKHFLETHDYLKISETNLPSPELSKKQGTFVTLTIDEALRGCIGNIEPLNPIYQDILENAVSSAFYDPRFLPLSKDEFNHVKIEISLLSIPQKLDYKNSTELLEKLSHAKPGVILQKEMNKATFLPQVWEELPSALDFLSQLCLKAGLSADEWIMGELEVKSYTAEVFHE